MSTFQDFGLSDLLLKSLTDMGFETPSPIQAQTLPLLLGDATDFVGLAATGTGKTAAFAIPLLERIDTSVRKVQALVLCPTRELALQVSGQINQLGHHSRIRSVAIYGGAGYREQIDGIRSGANIIVGTPGRVIDHLEKGTLTLGSLTTLILDEADEMISMGFKDELDRVLSLVPKETSNIWLFSATMSPEVRRVADTYLTEPKRVQVNRTEMLSATVEQSYFFTRESNKPDIVCKIIDMAEDFYGIIFCQTKALVADLSQFLSNQGYKVDSLHGDKDQKARERTMQLFRDRTVNVLVCTDVAARGLDVKDVTHVINYSIPRELDSYVHRIGRTARSGKTGHAISLVTPSHKELLRRVEKLTKTTIPEAQIPTRKDVGLKKVNSLLPKFMEQKFHERATSILSDEWAEALADMPGDEIAGRFLALMMPDIFEDKDADDRRRLPGPPSAGPSDDRGAPRYDRGPRSGGPDRGGPYRKTSRPRRDRDDAAPDSKIEPDREPLHRGSDFKGSYPKRSGGSKFGGFKKKHRGAR